MSERCGPPTPSAPCEFRGSNIITLKNSAVAVIGVLLLYTWFWWLVVGATCGFAVALCVAQSHKLRARVAALNLYLTVRMRADDMGYGAKERGCAACGAADCARHDPRITLDPWAGLRVHKQLDVAIEDFYNAILENFVSSWYNKITRQPYFLDELRHQLRHASAALLRRAHRINYSKFIVDKLIPCALHHHSIWMATQKYQQFSRDLHLSTKDSYEAIINKDYSSRKHNGSDKTEIYTNVPYTEHSLNNIESYMILNDRNIKKVKRRNNHNMSGIERSAVEGPLRCCLHPAVRNRTDELRYLRCITKVIMPYLLRKEEVDNKVFHVLIREIFAGWVLLSLTDVLADPYILNTLIVLATGDETMSTLPKNPNYKVEFLENFSRLSDAQRTRRARLLRVDLELVLSRPEYLYGLMTNMKTAGQLHLLQFCKDIKPFQMKILNPELTKNEEVSLFNEAWDLYVQYFDPDSPSAIPFQQAIVEEMRTVLSEGPANVKKLQTSKALYQSSKYADSLLENVFIPRFLHSEEFYNLFIGPRVPAGYHKQMTKKPQDKLYSTAIRFGNKLKSAIRTSTIDGQVLDVLTNSLDISEAGVSETDAVENMNILRYLDSLAEHTKLEEHDLSNWRVDFTHVEIRQLEPRRGMPGGVTRVFTISVQRPTLAASDTEYSRWTVQRSEHDLHLLRAKLVEFHGDTLLQDLALPSRRDNSPLETLRYKYEDFVQRLLRQRLLTASQLLNIFLTAEGDFGLAVQRASLGAGAADLGYIYQSVAHRLRKEKGQHLEPFINTFLLSSDMERYQAIMIRLKLSSDSLSPTSISRHSRCRIVPTKQVTSQAVEEAEEVEEAVIEYRCRTSERVRDIRNETFGNNFNLEEKFRIQRTDCTYQTKLTGFTRCIIYFLTKVLRARALVCSALGCVAGLFRDFIDHTFNSLLYSTLANVLSEQRLGHLIHLGHELLFINKQSSRSHTETEQYERARQQLHSRIPSTFAFVLGSEVMPALDNLLNMLQQPRLNKQLLYNLLDLCVAELFPELIETESLDKSR